MRSIIKTAKISPHVASQIDKAVEILRGGGIAAFPTDTVYGLGAAVFNLEAVEKVYEIKQRSRSIPLPILIAGIEQVTIVAETVPDIAWLLIRHFWPGGLTLVLPKAISLPANITSGSNRVAVRFPNHIVPVSLIRGLGTPIIGTSANISGKPSTLTAQEVKQQLGRRVDFVIDGGRCPGGVESTIVDVVEEIPVILRKGIIPVEKIEEISNRNIQTR